MDVFAAIADPVRRDLLRTLTAGRARVVDLAAGLPISRPAVSKHLRLLADAGLVEAQEVGRERHYGVRPGALSEVQAFIAEMVAAGQPPVTSTMLDALDLEVRRVGRDRMSTEPRPTARPHPMESA
jgi:DNA-binding transcriptional ArsR family regulator